MSPKTTATVTVDKAPQPGPGCAARPEAGRCSGLPLDRVYKFRRSPSCPVQPIDPGLHCVRAERRG